MQVDTTQIDSVRVRLCNGWMPWSLWLETEGVGPTSTKRRRSHHVPKFNRLNIILAILAFDHHLMCCLELGTLTREQTRNCLWQLVRHRSQSEWTNTCPGTWPSDFWACTVAGELARCEVLCSLTGLAPSINTAAHWLVKHMSNQEMISSCTVTWLQKTPACAKGMVGMVFVAGSVVSGGCKSSTWNSCQTQADCAHVCKCGANSYREVERHRERERESKIWRP